MRLGRPPKGRRSSQPHKRRPDLKPTQPVLVTIRITDELEHMRTRDVYRAIRWATIAVGGRADCRIVHTSIQNNHLHLIVEAQDRMALARGMQAFQISAAKHVNVAVSCGRPKGAAWWAARKGSKNLRWWNAKTRAWQAGRRKGTVFPDRYHEEIITTPRQARNALCYVLNNWRKHREDQHELSEDWLIDPFSSAWAFGGWKERGDTPFAWKTRETYEPMLAAYPQTWLLREGWKRGGGPISVYAVPSAHAKR